MEQEEGWLMGIKEATGRQGLFPANFTRPIWSERTATHTDMEEDKDQTTYETHLRNKWNRNQSTNLNRKKKIWGFKKQLKRFKKTKKNARQHWNQLSTHTLIQLLLFSLLEQKGKESNNFFFFPFLVWKVLIRSDALSFHHRPPLLPYFFKEEWDVFTSALLPPFSQWS